MIIYFTGTGNSKYCADILSDYLGENIADAGQLIKEDKGIEYDGSETLVFVCPTYSWQIPEVFERFIREENFVGAKRAYFVMTCGEDIGDAGNLLKKLCAEKGWKFGGVYKVVMPENYIAMFDVPDEKRCEELLKKAPEALKKAAECIRSSEAFPSEKITLTDKVKTHFIKPLFYKTVVSNRKFTVSEKCVSCGKCERVCVFGSLSMKDGRPQWVKKDCTHCMACISVCPVNAIEYGKKSRGKRRYLCPEWKKL